MEQYYLYGFIALGVLLIIAFIMIYLLYGKLNRIQKKQLRLDEKLSGKKAGKYAFAGRAAATEGHLHARQPEAVHQGGMHR